MIKHEDQRDKQSKNYLFRSKPAAFSEPLTGGKACSLRRVNFKVGRISDGILLNVLKKSFESWEFRVNNLISLRTLNVANLLQIWREIECHFFIFYFVTRDLSPTKY